MAPAWPGDMSGGPPRVAVMKRRRALEFRQDSRRVTGSAASDKQSW